MNKIIKFRVYHKEQGCMYFTKLSIGTEGDGWIDSIDFERKKIQLGCQADEGDYINWFPFEQVEFMQFIGLLDRHGKEIYEEDVLESIYKNQYGTFKHRSIVKANDKYTGNGDYDNETIIGGWEIDTKTFHPLESFEVIGNIYQNQKLLEEF